MSSAGSFTRKLDQEALFFCAQMINTNVEQHQTENRPLWNSTWNLLPFWHWSIYTYSLFTVFQPIVWSLNNNSLLPIFLQLTHENVIWYHTKNLIKVHVYYVHCIPPIHETSHLTKEENEVGLAWFVFTNPYWHLSLQVVTNWLFYNLLQGFLRYWSL